MTAGMSNHGKVAAHQLAIAEQVELVVLGDVVEEQIGEQTLYGVNGGESCFVSYHLSIQELVRTTLNGYPKAGPMNARWVQACRRVEVELVLARHSRS
jgi:hypothetical protein